jgi:hypothetical protein
MILFTLSKGGRSYNNGLEAPGGGANVEQDSPEMPGVPEGSCSITTSKLLKFPFLPSPCVNYKLIYMHLGNL